MRDPDILRVVKRFIRGITRLFVILCIETSPIHLQLNLSLSNITNKPNSIETKTACVNSPTKISNSPQSHFVRSSQATSSSLINSKLARLKSLTNHFTNSNSNSSSSCGSSSSATSSNSSSSQIALLVTVTPLTKCEYVLRQFAPYAVDELADVANALIGPVILGLSKPTTFKVSITSGGAGSSTSSSNGDFSSSSNNNNNSPLAEEIFNVEPSLLRQFSAAISTSIVCVKSSMEKTKAVESNVVSLAANKTSPQFVNTFETVDVSVPPPSLMKSSELVNADNFMGK